DDADRAGKPAGGDEAEAAACAGFADVEDGEAVVVGVGNVQCFVVIAEGYRVAGSAAELGRINGGVEGLQHLRLFDVDHGHRIVVGVRHVEKFSVAGDAQVVGVVTDGDGVGDRVLLRIE